MNERESVSRSRKRVRCNIRSRKIAGIMTSAAGFWITPLDEFPDLSHRPPQVDPPVNDRRQGQYTDYDQTFPNIRHQLRGVEPV